LAERVYRLTAESVTEGHPDKMCDQISDAVLDYALSEDPTARVAVETMVSTGTCIVAGEVTTQCYIPVEDVVRGVIEDIGYTRAKFGFDYETAGVLVALHKQSPDIAQGVDVGGAGDQGMMYGYATNETPEYMPAPIMLSHKLAKRLADVRKSGELSYLRPDGKTQVTVEYEDDVPKRVVKVLLAAQHGPGLDQCDIRADLIDAVIDPIIPDELKDPGMEILVNRTGKFVVGGPQGDTGLTGRKIIVDTYGGAARHGGGAFSGKDPTKVDRSGAYMMRYVAKNIVAAGLADRCELQVSYAIGDPQPFSVAAFCQGTQKISENDICCIVTELFDLSPHGIIDKLDLQRPIYRKTAAYGHFGRSEPEFTWERLDMVDEVRSAAGL
jgi:S-adenosylmethionine synthetase